MNTQSNNEVDTTIDNSKVFLVLGNLSGMMITTVLYLIFI